MICDAVTFTLSTISFLFEMNRHTTQRINIFVEKKIQNQGLLVAFADYN